MTYFDGSGNEVNIGADIDDSVVKQAVIDYLDSNPSVLTVFDNKLIGKKIINGEYDRIICLGDSITYGTGGTNGYCYATAFRKFINGRYGITVKQMGYAGSDASYQYGRIMSETKSNSLVIWLTGTNNRDTGSKWTSYKENMASYVQSIKTICTDILIMSCTPAPDDSSKSVKTADIDDFLKKTFYGSEYFIGMNQKYIEYFGSNISESFNDHVHPNDTGYLGIFKILCNELGLPLDYQTDYSQTGTWWNA